MQCKDSTSQNEDESVSSKNRIDWESIIANENSSSGDESLAEIHPNVMGVSRNEEDSDDMDEVPLIKLQKRKTQEKKEKKGYFPEENRKRARSRSSSESKEKDIYTPLEKQYIELRKKYKDSILAIEVGYKFRFFGDDAKTVSKALGIGCYYEHNFLNASVPSYRIDFHLERLINAGLKVAVARQTETAVFKSTGNSRNTLFERDVVGVYTKGTFINESTSWYDQRSNGSIQDSQYIFCVVDNPISKKAPFGKVQIGFLCTQLSSGTFIYDQFEDDILRTNLQTRLSHFQPCEILFSNELSSESVSLLNHYITSEQVIGRKICIQNVNQHTAKASLQNVCDFFSSKFYDYEQVIVDLHLEKIKSLPTLSIVCLEMTISYLTEFSLENILTMSDFYQPFSHFSSMILSKQTMDGLEVFSNQTDQSSIGSLFWVLDHTYTRFGQRLLQQWIKAPLLSANEINNRLDAVEELSTGFNENTQILRKLLHRLPDLEKGLARIYYQKCSPSELLYILKGFYRASIAFSSNPNNSFQSSLLNSLVKQLPTILYPVDQFLASFTHAKAAENNKLEMFQNVDDFDSVGDSSSEDSQSILKVREHKMGILMVETELNIHLQEIRDYLNYQELNYTTWGNMNFCIELSRGCKNIPEDWIRVSATRSLIRYHTPKVQAFILELAQHKEALAVSCEEIYISFLKKISGYYNELRRVAVALASLDCLLSFACVSSQTGYVRPQLTIHDFYVEDSRHPMIELLTDEPYVPNDIYLSAKGIQTLLITGPNMGGKTSIVKQLALTSLMAQCGCFVPAKSARLPLLDSILVRLGSTDNIFLNMSTFMVEMHETNEILNKATDKSLIIFDELGRGTSTVDGEAISYAVLYHLNYYIRPYLLFVTHYPGLGVLEKQFSHRLRSYHMGYVRLEGRDQNAQNISFLYKLVPGIASRSYGLNVARMAGIPISIIHRAEEISEEHERDQWLLRKNRTLLKLKRFIQSYKFSQSDLEELFSCLSTIETNEFIE
ncbi:MutS protein 3 [Schizosaccharomyces cryophilus OY26]|uniref:DNA mismatch repair protein MSH3 n=1 Tax=Schizosaccharomyces cryophilus (strain OY26 / ATCC MYA-4695 / CBS 11777 / NBRC 106824 / NRRL Y48691) TaxID=653667 RepID=S9W400_SCHCR|nr:MutS protein 3 [Schizosaccharomyces cryophilus OY26]EPY53259.1 MutS protein 3 [Schizosaccharomyces cryophilus OY26]